MGYRIAQQSRALSMHLCYSQSILFYLYFCAHTFQCLRTFLLSLEAQLRSGVSKQVSPPPPAPFHFGNRLHYLSRQDSSYFSPCRLALNCAMNQFNMWPGSYQVSHFVFYPPSDGEKQSLSSPHFPRTFIHAVYQFN